MFTLTRSLSLCAVAMATALLQGCPLLPQPPFDASGNYEGAWETAEVKTACPFLY